MPMTGLTDNYLSGRSREAWDTQDRAQSTTQGRPNPAAPAIWRREVRVLEDISCARIERSADVLLKRFEALTGSGAQPGRWSKLAACGFLPRLLRQRAVPAGCVDNGRSSSSERHSDLRLSPAPEPSRAGGLSWLLAAFCLVSSASAQYRLDVWTTDDRLPQNGIREIHQTPDEYLWGVTFDGLVRFDGIPFTVFNKSNSPRIDSNRFDSLYEERNGELWLGTQDGGVTRYRHGSFTMYTTLNGLPHNHVRRITGDDAGNLWVLAGDSIMQWQEITGRFIDVTPKDLRIPYWPLLWEGQGGFWGSDPAGIHCFRKGRFVTYPLPH